MSDLLNDVAVSVLWTQDKVARRAAWNSNKAILSMLSDLLGPNIMGRSQIPRDVVVRTLAAHENREVRADAAYIVDAIAGIEVKVLPPQWSVRNLVVVNNFKHIFQAVYSLMFMAQGVLAQGL